MEVADSAIREVQQVAAQLSDGEQQRILGDPAYRRVREEVQRAHRNFDGALLHDSDHGLDRLRDRVQEAHDDLARAYVDAARRFGFTTSPPTHEREED